MAPATVWLRHSYLLLSSPPGSRCLFAALGLPPSPSLANALPAFFPKARANPSFSISATLSSSSSRPSSHTTNGTAADIPVASPEFHLHNTLTKRKEPFRPKVAGKVGMYVCGITAYDLSHIGHARVSVVFDVLYRYLKHLNYEVVYVRNFTDVDDKIIARANELGEDPLSLSSFYCDEFLSDMVHLNCLPPTVEPRVSTHMNEIINMIKQILDNGYAYMVDGDVYFFVDKFPFYGQLSGRRLEDNQPGQRVAVDSRKQNPADFALWKSSKAGEPYWESPWGPGRPGWHIECSAMSSAYLGHSFDIHGGGVDLVFPHHENEIAQSCAACKESSIGYWVHNGFVDVGSEKMSKSLGNFVTIRQVIDLYHPLALRLFLIGTHYRSTISYSKAQLEASSDRLYYIFQEPEEEEALIPVAELWNFREDFAHRWKETLLDCENSLVQYGKDLTNASIPKDTADCINKFQVEFEKSLADDLHTPVALAMFSEPLKLINDLLHTRKGKKQHMRMESLKLLGKEVKDGLAVLGLQPSSFAEALVQMREKALKRAGITEEHVLRKIEERNEARKMTLYDKSDDIRRELAVVGVALMDGPDGTSWRPGVPLHLQEQLAPAA